MFEREFQYEKAKLWSDTFSRKDLFETALKEKLMSDKTACFQIERDHFSISGSLSQDKIKLFIDVHRKGELEGVAASEWPRIPEQDILAALAGSVSQQLLNHGVIKSIAKELESSKECLNRRIARGQPPKPGHDGKIVFLVRTLQKTATPDQDQTQAIRQLRLFENISIGQVVARIYAPRPGESGVDALGNPIPAEQQKPVVFSHDKSLEKRTCSGKSYDELVALQEGLLEQNDDGLRINDHLVIPGDLDFRFGNIHFVGAVTIKGHVNTNFSVYAEKDLHITGSVQRSQVISQKGKLTIDGFIVGPEAQAISRSSDVQIAGATAALIESAGNLLVRKECMNSECWVSGSVLAPEATLIGGSYHVLCGLEAKRFGNEQGIKTSVNLSSDIELSVDFRNLMQRLAQHDQAIQTLQLHLGPFARKPQLLKSMDPAFQLKMEKLLKKLQLLLESKQKLEIKVATAKAQAQYNITPRVNVHKSLFPGVSIHHQDQIFSVAEKLDGPKSVYFSPETLKFEIGKLEVISCELAPSKLSIKEKVDE